jgi:hypothetical protein
MMIEKRTKEHLETATPKEEWYTSDHKSHKTKSRRSLINTVTPMSRISCRQKTRKNEMRG